MPPESENQSNDLHKDNHQQKFLNRIPLLILLQITSPFVVVFIFFFSISLLSNTDSLYISDFLGYAILFILGLFYIGLPVSNLFYSVQIIKKEGRQTHFRVILLFAITMFMILVSLGIAYAIYESNDKNVSSTDSVLPIGSVVNKEISQDVIFELDNYVNSDNGTSSVNEIKSDKVEIKYINTKAKLLKASNGHYISGKGFNTPSPEFFYDGNQIIDKSMLANNGYLSDWALSGDGLRYAFVIGHYPHYPATPETNTHDLYVDGQKIKSAHEKIVPSVSSGKKPSTSHTLLYYTSATSSTWMLDGKPFQIDGKNFPIWSLESYTPGAGYVEMKDNTIYVYKTDKTYVDNEQKPQMSPNSFNSLNEEISVIMDKVSGTGSQNTSVQFKGKMINNSDWKEIFLNGMGGNTSSSELVFDSSQFFILPPKLESAQTIYGELFSVSFSQVALPGDYTASASIQGGDNQQTYDVMVTADVTLQVK